MSDNVSAFPGSKLDSDRRTNFLAQVAASFDGYVQATGEEPDAIVYVLGGLRQDCRCGWLVQGDSEGAATAVLTLAEASILRHTLSPP